MEGRHSEKKSLNFLSSSGEVKVCRVDLNEELEEDSRLLIRPPTYPHPHLLPVPSIVVMLIREDQNHAKDPIHEIAHRSFLYWKSIIIIPGLDPASLFPKRLVVISNSSLPTRPHTLYFQFPIAERHSFIYSWGRQ